MASTAADIIASAKAEAEAAKQSAIASLSGLGTDITNAYNTQQQATTANYQNQLNELQNAYNANAKAAYGNYMSDKQQLNNQLVRLGLQNTGYGVSQGLLSAAAYSKNLAGLQSAYQTNRGKLGIAEQQALADLYSNYAKNKLNIDQYIYEAGRSAYDTAYKNSYQAQQDSIANALQAQYYNYLMTKAGSGGYDEPGLEPEGNTEDTQLTNVKKWSPLLSTQKANKWYSTNIDSVYAKSGLTAKQLESILSNGLKNNSITKQDAEDILSTFGL